MVKIHIAVVFKHVPAARNLANRNREPHLQFIFRQPVSFFSRLVCEITGILVKFIAQPSLVTHSPTSFAFSLQRARLPAGGVEILWRLKYAARFAPLTRLCDHAPSHLLSSEGGQIVSVNAGTRNRYLRSDFPSPSLNHLPAVTTAVVCNRLKCQRANSRCCGDGLSGSVSLGSSLQFIDHALRRRAERVGRPAQVLNGNVAARQSLVLSKRHSFHTDNLRVDRPGSFAVGGDPPAGVQCASDPPSPNHGMVTAIVPGRPVRTPGLRG